MSASNPKAEPLSPRGSAISNPSGKEHQFSDLGSPLSPEDERPSQERAVEEVVALRALVAAQKKEIAVGKNNLVNANRKITAGLKLASEYRAELVRFREQKDLLWAVSADTYAVNRYIVLLNLYIFFKYYPIRRMQLITHNVAVYSFTRSSDFTESCESQDPQPLYEADEERTLFLEEGVVQVASFLKRKGLEGERSWQSYIKHIKNSVNDVVRYEATPRMDTFLGGLFNDGFIEEMISSARPNPDDDSNDEELRWSCIWNHLQSLGRAQQDGTGPGHQLQELNPAILKNSMDRTLSESLPQKKINEIKMQVADEAFTNVEHRLRSNHTSSKLCPMFSYDFRAALVFEGIATTKEVDMVTCFSKRHRVLKWERNSSAHSLTARKILDVLKLMKQPHQDLPPWVRADADMWALLEKHLYKLIGGGFFETDDFVIYPELADLCKLYNPGLMIGIEDNDDSHDDSGDMMMHSSYEYDSGSEVSEHMQMSYMSTPALPEHTNLDGSGNLETLRSAYNDDVSPYNNEDTDDEE